MTDQQKVREAFEAHILKLNPCSSLHRHHGGAYRTVSIERAWQLWQAALAHASSATVKENLTVGVWMDPSDVAEVMANGSSGSPDRKRWVLATGTRTMTNTVRLCTSPASSSEDARDAARYRWLRNDQTGMAEVAILVGRFGDVEIKFGDELDQAIDQALAAERGEA